MTWKDVVLKGDYYRQCLCAYKGDRFGVETVNLELQNYSLWGGNFFKDHEIIHGKNPELLEAKKKYSLLNRIKNFFLDNGKKRKRNIKRIVERLNALDNMISIFRVNYVENGKGNAFYYTECEEGIIYKTLKDIDALLKRLKYL